MSHKTTYRPLQFDHVHPYAYWCNAFSKDECEEIIKFGSQFIEDGHTIGSTGNLRKSEIGWIFPEDEINWVYDRLAAMVTSINDQFFKFNIAGLAEGLQFTKYTEPDGVYGSHVDRAFNHITRKISISIQLSNQESYTGGDLLFHIEKDPIVAPKQQGTLIAFPSYTLHEVTPVTVGTRYSLVAWVTGESFK